MASFKVFNILVLIASGLLLASLVFQILPTISAPVTSLLYLSKVNEFSFGVFGYCDASSSDCSIASVGYDIPLGVDYNDFKIEGYDVRIKLSKILILHPVASFLNLVVTCMTLSLFLFEDLPRLESMISVTMMIDAVCIICNIIVFIVDIVLFVPHVNYLGWLVVIGVAGTVISMGLLFLAKREVQKVLYYSDGASTVSENADQKRSSSMKDFKSSQTLYTNNTNLDMSNGDDKKMRMNSVSMFDEEELAAEKEAHEKDMVHKRVAELANSEFDGTNEQNSNIRDNRLSQNVQYYYNDKTKQGGQLFPEASQNLQPGIYYDRYDGEGVRKSSLDPTAPNGSPFDIMDSRISNIVPVDMSIYQSKTTPNFERMSHFDHASYLDRISYFERNKADFGVSKVINNRDKNARKKKRNAHKNHENYDVSHGVWGNNSSAINSPRKSINSKIEGNISKYGTSDSSLEISGNTDEIINKGVPSGESSTIDTSESSIIANHQQGVDSISNGKMTPMVTGGNNQANNGNIILVSGGNHGTNYGESNSQLSFVKEEGVEGYNNASKNPKNSSSSGIDFDIAPIATLSEISTTDDSEYNRKGNEEHIFRSVSQIRPNNATKNRLDKKIQEIKIKQRKKTYLVNGYDSSN